jgi:hypothetical protein
MNKNERTLPRLHTLTDKDMKESRERVDKAVERFKKSPIFTKDDYERVRSGRKLRKEGVHVH